MIRGIVAGLAAGALWGLVFVAPRMAPGFSPVDLTAGRFVEGTDAVQLYAARRTRTLAADDSIPEVVWWITAFGTTLTIGFTFLFGTRNFSMHLAMTGMVAASMSLVIVLIVSLDRPFRGELSISTQAYENARGSIAAVDALLNAPPH